MIRIAVVAVYHETNTFASTPTTESRFRARWHEGVAEVDAAFRGTRTVIGGFLDSRLVNEAEWVAGFGCFATPSGPVEAAAFDAILAGVEAQLAAAGPLDGILLELHGAMVVEGRQDAEQDVLDRIRAITAAPLAAVTDLHTNAATPRFSGADLVVGYRTNPHVDTFETGRRAADLLRDWLGSGGAGSGIPRVRVHAGLAVVAAPLAQRTDDEPLRTLLAEAARLESELGLIDLTVHAGYAYQDVPYLGMGFVATAHPARRAAAADAVERLREIAAVGAPAFARPLLDPGAALATALGRPGSVVVADTGDNINGGAPGDTTSLHRTFLADPLGRRAIGTIADPAQLSRITDSWERDGPGAIVDVALGGWSSPLAGGPLIASATVLAVTDGRFRNIGPMAHGLAVDMNGAALVRIGPLDLVVQGRAVQPNDPGMFESMGVDLAALDVALLKGAGALRSGWAAFAERFVDAATDGETPSDLARLPYRNASPILPPPPAG